MNTLVHTKLEGVLTSLGEVLVNAVGENQEAISQIDSKLAELREELDLVLNEHAGMATELLRTYEQLGIIFEVTSKLSTVNTEEDVVKLFVDSLQITYHENKIYFAENDAQDELFWPRETPPYREVLEKYIAESREKRQVIVSSMDKPTDDISEVMSAPVFSGDDFVCAIVLVHGKNAADFVASDMNLIEAMTLFCGDLLRNYHLADELRGLSINMVRSLVNAIDQKDNYTSGHSNRVGDYARLLGEELGMDEEELQLLEWSALLHDVGKIGIRDDVLKKPGKLTDAEFQHIREHPVKSYELMKGVPQLKAALAGVRHHHEKFDGTGYPDKLKGKEIPLHARIIQVVDIFDALTTTRSYRAAFDVEKALSILHEEAGTVSDPDLVELFDKIVRREAELGRLQCEQPPEID